jgi:glycine cleavage system H protein
MLTLAPERQAEHEALTIAPIEQLDRNQPLMRLGIARRRPDYWMRRTGNVITIGLHPAALDHFEILSMTWRVEPDEYVDEGTIIGEIGAWASDVLLCSPFAGVVVDVNRDLESDATVLEQDPFGAGWLIRLVVD